MWQILEHFGVSCCEAIQGVVSPNPLDDVLDKNLYAKEYFFDAQSVVHSSVSSWSDVDESCQFLPVRSISFPMAETTAPSAQSLSRRENKLQEPCQDNHHPPISDHSSWCDTASFMTPREHDEEYQQIDDWNGGTAIGHFGEDDDDEVPFDEQNGSHGSLDRAGESCHGPLSKSSTSAVNGSRESVSSFHNLRDDSIHHLHAKLNDNGAISEGETIRDYDSNRTLCKTKLDLAMQQNIPRPIARGDTPDHHVRGGRTPWAMVTPRRSGLPRKIKNGESSSSSTESSLFPGLEDSSVESWGIEPRPVSAAHLMFRNIDTAFAHNQTRAAITIQRAVRGFSARVLARQMLELLVRDTAALIIQDGWLTWHSYKREKKKLHQQHFLELQQDEEEEKGEEDLSMAGTIVPSNDGYEVLFGTEQLQCVMPCTTIAEQPLFVSFCEDVCGLSDCDDEDDLFSSAVSAEDPLDWTMFHSVSPPRRDFLQKRFAMSMLPLVIEEQEEDDISDEDPCESRGSFLPHSQSLDSDHDMELNALNQSGSAGSLLELVPPPQVRRHVRLPSTDSNVSVLSHETVSVNESRLTSTSYVRIFGIVELARWLQANTRMRLCRRRFLRFCQSISCIQIRFRYKRKKSITLEESASVLQRWIRRTQVNHGTSAFLQSSASNLHDYSNSIIQTKSTRPPLYPEACSPRQQRVVCTSKLPWSLDGLVVPIHNLIGGAPVKVEETCNASNHEAALQWPVPNTHYQHRTVLLSLPKKSVLQHLSSDDSGASAFSRETWNISHVDTRSEKSPGSFSAITPQLSEPRDDFHIGNKESETRESLEQVDKQAVICRHGAMHQDSKDFGKSASIIQRFVHQELTRKRKEQLDIAATFLQCRVRASQVRKRYVMLLEKVSLLQSTVRMFLVRGRVALARRSAVLIQNIVRASKCQKQYRAKQNTLSVLQGTSRVLIHRRQTTTSPSKVHHYMQSSNFCARDAQDRSDRARKYSSLSDVVASYACDNLSLEANDNAQPDIQPREENRQCADFQTVLRNCGLASLTEQKDGFVATAILQQYERTRKACFASLKHQAAVVLIQRVYRGSFCRRETRLRSGQILSGAKRIQSWYRGSIYREACRKEKHAVLLLQNSIKREDSQRALRTQLRAALSIQHMYRQVKNDRAMKAINRAAIVIQSCARRRRVQLTDSVRRRAAVEIQRIYRGFKHWRFFEVSRTATIVLQKHARRRQAQISATFMICAVCLIQKSYRGFVSRKKDIELQCAAITLQKYERRRASQKAFLAFKRAACLIQAVHRGINIRDSNTKRRGAAVLLQKYERRRRCRRKARAFLAAASIVQGVYRLFRNRRQIQKEEQAAAFLIQRWYRDFLSQSLLPEKANMHTGSGSEVSKLPCCLIPGEVSLKRRFCRRSCLTKSQDFYRSQQIRLRRWRLIRAQILLERISQTGCASQCFKRKKITLIQKSCCRSVRRTRYIQKDDFRMQEFAQFMQRKNQLFPTRLTTHSAAVTIQTAIRSMACRRRYLRELAEARHWWTAATRASYSLATNQINSRLQLDDVPPDSLSGINVRATTVLDCEESVETSLVTRCGSSAGKYQASCCSRSKRTRNFRMSRTFYVSLVAVTLLAVSLCPLTLVKQARAKSRSVLDLQLKAVRAQAARSRNCHLTEHRVLSATEHHARFTWGSALVAEHAAQNEELLDTMSNSVEIMQSSAADGANCNTLRESHNAALVNMKKLQDALRQIVQVAAVQELLGDPVDPLLPSLLLSESQTGTLAEHFSSTSSSRALVEAGGSSKSMEVMSFSKSEQPSAEWVPRVFYESLPSHTSMTTSPKIPKPHVISSLWFSQSAAAFLNPPPGEKRKVEIAAGSPSDDIELLLQVAKNPARSYLEEWKFLIKETRSV